MKACILLRKNIIVSGGTGSGKTTLLNVFSSYLPESDRIVTIEDAAELRLKQAHVVRLEARPPNIEGKGAVTIRDLVRNALRMRPDRIVIGECRGGEALDMLQAMNTGHDGSLTTIHANTPRDVISRLETMVLMSGMDLPVRAIREQVASAVDVIVHESRLSDGTRKVVNITEIVGLEGDQITMQDIFEFEQTGVDAQGKVIGQFKPTGSVPTFIEDLAARGHDDRPNDVRSVEVEAEGAGDDRSRACILLIPLLFALSIGGLVYVCWTRRTPARSTIQARIPRRWPAQFEDIFLFIPPKRIADAGLGGTPQSLSSWCSSWHGNLETVQGVVDRTRVRRHRRRLLPSWRRGTCWPC